jgi:hypothetical protein
MNSEADLIQKLMISKQIMDKHNQTPRGGVPSMESYSSPQVESYEPAGATYNIPQELLQESQQSEQPYLSSIPKTPTMPQTITKDRVMSSKLPDEIKRLMIEHPIEQPTSMGGGATLSNDLVEKAARLMGTDARGNQTVQPKQKLQEQKAPTTGFNMNELKAVLREVVEEVLQENGILSESEQKSNEVFSFKVGKHIFEGKVTKIKKIS